MHTNLRGKLKKSYIVIKRRLSERDVSAWLCDNFYVIDKHYRKALSDKQVLKCDDMFNIINRYCADRDYIPTPNTLIRYLKTQKNDFSYRELCAVRTLLSVCSIIKIGNILTDNKQMDLLPNSIKLLHSLTDPEYDDVLPSVWKPEESLEQYEKQYNDYDSDTKWQYRKAVADYAKMHSISETEAVTRLIKESATKKIPLGTMLFSAKKSYATAWYLTLGTVFVLLSLLSFYFIGWITLLLLIPFSVASGAIADQIISMTVPAYRAPRLTLSKIPDNAKTLVTVASLMTGGKSDNKVFESLSRFKYMNPDDNVYFCLLADLPDSDSPYQLNDNEIIESAHKKIDELNKLHGERFCLFFRERLLNKSENKYGGWERKRGAVCELVSHIIHGGKSEYYGGNFIRDIKYILTLDSDTNLSVGSVNELLSVALHPANRPVIKDGCVVSGYGIIQPTVRTELKSAYRTGFSRLISGAGGADVYANAAFVRSQTLFGSGSFCGKGLINVSLFDTLISDKLPEGLILSHDVIEGSILRTLAASDITFTDSTPGNTVSFFRRHHRWLRGDFQNLYFLFTGIINRFSKVRLLLTALKHLSPISSILAIVIGCFLSGTSGLSLFLLAYSEFLLPCVLTVVRFLFSGSPFACLRFFSKAYSMLTQTFMRVFFEISSSCRRATLTLHALYLAFYRLFTKKKTLEWTTAAQTEKLSGTLGKYVLDGAVSALIGFTVLMFARPPFMRFTGLLYFIYPLISLVLSRNVGGGEEARPTVSEKQKKILKAHVSDMFDFYRENVAENTNYLPPDNVQLSPITSIAMRTSPTNIGFYLVSLLAARDIDLITSTELYENLDNSLKTVESLDKYNGNLFNWYDISDLTVIGDRYVSSVDSGNFVVMLVALKEGLLEYIGEDNRIESIISRIETLISQTDLSILYDNRRDLFRIGIKGNVGIADSGCYDMLMSEARMTAYYAVASSIVPKKHWGALGRTLTHKGGYIGMMSWSGTAFEYLMPQLFLPLYRDSFMYESIAFSLMVQRSAFDIWGVSESGFYSFDSEMHYQYKANGIQSIALRRIASNEKIISPYSTYLSLCIYGNAAMKNLSALEKRGMYGKYGFYEALDMNSDSDGICVKSYMAHHVGMSIIASINAIRDNIFVRRFMSDKSMSAANELLQEKIPIDAHVFGDNFGSLEESKRAIIKRSGHTESADPENPTAVLLNRGDLSAIVTSSGHIAINCGDKMITHTEFEKDSLRFTAGVVFSRAGKSYGCVPLYGGDGYGFERKSDSVSHIVSGKEFSGSVGYSMAKNSNCLCISTRAEALKQYDITFVFEPVLESRKKYLSHISFSRLFIESEYDQQKRILYFHRRSSLDGKYVFSLAVAPRNRDMNFSFLTSRENLSVSSISSPLDYALETTDNKIGACIDPLCLVRASNADGGRSEFLITCGVTKQECEGNIRLARTNKGNYPISNEEEIFERMLPSLLYNSGATRVTEFSRCGIGDLWSRGISGDHPLAVVLISEIAVTRTDAVLKSFLSLARACIRCELIFMISDSDNYNRPIEASIRERCANVGVSQYIGRNGGIFLIRQGEVSSDLLSALKNKAHFYIDFSNDTPRITENKQSKFEEIITSPQNASPLPVPSDAAKSSNGYFITDGFVVDKSTLPKAPYSFVLTGKRFSSVITQSSLGYTFYDNARERRLCSFYGDVRSLDNGERIYLKTNGKKYDLCAISNKVTYEKGRAVYHGEAEDVSYTVTVVIPPKFPVKLIRVQYKKGSSHETCFEVKPVMGDSVQSVNGIETKAFTASTNQCLMFKNVFGMTFPEGYGFAGVCDGYTDKNENAIYSNENDILFFLGACTTESGAKKVAQKINKRFFETAYKEAYDFANSLIPRIQISTRSDSHNRMMNFFLPYQISACRFYARGSFYQSGGAYGFRDQLQDSLSIIYSSPETVRTHIFRCCAHQYLEGCVMHWWHTRHFGRVNRGIKSKCSDDMLYLPIVVCDYIEKTGDTGILDTKVHYLSSPPLGNRNERYEQPELSDIKESVYQHCLRALAYAERFGKNGLILMGSCDWNDGFSLVGEKGIGESVFSSLLFIIAAKMFIPICQARGEFETAQHYSETVKTLRNNIEEKAFFGDRYARAICDDGKILGIEGCDECEIDILSQAFAAIAKLDPERTRLGLNTAFNTLYDRKNKIFKLFSPPFTNGETRVGYIRGYVAGIRENGGQYTHGALWGALGCLISGMTEEALLILDCANPAARCSDKELSRAYKIEPYAVAADIYSGQYTGRGGWSWYTGAASWYYRIMLEYVLGLKFGANRTLISATPKIEYEADINCGNTNLHIKASYEISKLTLDDNEITFPLSLTDGNHQLELPIK